MQVHHDEHATTDGASGHSSHENHDEHAHDAHAGHSVAMFRDRFWLSLLLSVPVLIWSEMLQDLLGYSAPDGARRPLDPARLRHGRLRLRRLALPEGGLERAPRPDSRA